MADEKSTRALNPKIGLNTGKILVDAAVVKVDVGDKPIIPVVIRNGYEVSQPIFNKGRVDDFVARLPPAKRPGLPRVLTQSVPAGQRVAKGTTIDVIVVPPADIRFDLFDNVHEQLRERAVSDVHKVTENPDIKPLLAKAAFSELSEVEQARLRAAANQLDISIDDTQANRSLAATFNSLKTAQAFE